MFLVEILYVSISTVSSISEFFGFFFIVLWVLFSNIFLKFYGVLLGLNKHMHEKNSIQKTSPIGVRI
jgi:hypothetical protein